MKVRSTVGTVVCSIIQRLFTYQYATDVVSLAQAGERESALHALKNMFKTTYNLVSDDASTRNFK